MIAVALALLAAQAATPAPQSDVPVQRAASPRALSGRFTCDARVYDLTIAATPASQTIPARLDRLTIDGRAIDAGSMAEAARLVARLADIRALDVRCAGDSAELSIYGEQRLPDATFRRARIRGTITGTAVRGLAMSVEQPRR